MDFHEVTGWGDDDWGSDITGVAVDSCDRVYTLRREQPQVTVLRPDGAVIDRWGDDRLSDRPHLISVDHQDVLYIADDGGHQVHVFTPSGTLKETLGSGIPSETGYDGFTVKEDAYDQMAGGPPFNRPTKAVASRNGDVFVTDGYRNCRVHRFSADRRTVKSWGGSGSDAGCFVIPHGLTLDNDGNVLVCDRENDRIQVFSQDGELLHVWNHVRRPTDVAVDPLGYVYVTELARGPRDLKSWRLETGERELPGRVTIWSPQGHLVGELCPPAMRFQAPHAIAVDSTGAIYVAEVPDSFNAFTGRPRQAHRCLHKFIRADGATPRRKTP